MASLREVYNDGYRRVCIGCNTVFTPDEVRKEWYDIGHIIEGEDGKLYICRQPVIGKDSIYCE